uniref:ABC transporter family protein n=1 Tax=Rhizophora mucronata TaxID=61149 RepID=A0A2P2M4G8_RHIMU
MFVFCGHGFAFYERASRGLCCISCVASQKLSTGALDSYHNLLKLFILSCHALRTSPLSLVGREVPVGNCASI